MSRHHPLLARATLIGFAALAVTGCSNMDVIRDCRDLAAAINPPLAELKKQAPASGDDAEGFLRVAPLYSDLAKKVVAVPRRTPQLDTTVRDYKGMCQRTANAARDLAKALKKKSKSDIRSARSALVRQQRRQSALNGRMRRLCALSGS